MAQAAITRGKGRRATRNSSIDDVLKDADRLLDLVMMDVPPVDNRTRQRPHGPRTTVAGHAPKRLSGERRRRSDGSQESKEASKKSKKTLADDGSRDLDDDEDDDYDDADCDTVDNSRSDRSGRPTLEMDSVTVGAPKLILSGRGGRAPLAVEEDSTVTPEADSDVGHKMGLLKCRSVAPDDDTPDGVLNAAGESFDDVDGEPDEPVDENERILKEIAMKLRTIGDHENSKINFGSMSKSASSVSLSIAMDGIQDLLSNLTYDKFQDAVNKNMGNEPGVQQVTVMFRLASAAARKLKNGSAGAVVDLKRIAFDYFRNHAADWVSQNGGWAGISELL